MTGVERLEGSSYTCDAQNERVCTKQSAYGLDIGDTRMHLCTSCFRDLAQIMDVFADLDGLKRKRGKR